MRLTPWVCSRITSRATSTASSDADGEAGVGLVERGLADLERVDGVVPAVLEDVVEHAGQDPRVDQVAADLDGLADHGMRPSSGGRRQTTAPSSPPRSFGGRSFMRATSVTKPPTKAPSASRPAQPDDVEVEDRRDDQEQRAAEQRSPGRPADRCPATGSGGGVGGWKWSSGSSRRAPGRPRPAAPRSRSWSRPAAAPGRGAAASRSASASAGTSSLAGQRGTSSWAGSSKPATRVAQAISSRISSR